MPFPTLLYNQVELPDKVYSVSYNNTYQLILLSTINDQLQVIDYYSFYQIIGLKARTGIVKWLGSNNYCYAVDNRVKFKILRDNNTLQKEFV